MELGCVFAPTLDTPDHIALAEELGYARAYVYDSPAVYADAGVTVALAARMTSHVRLGIAVVTSHTRHLVTTAGLVAHLAGLAPGRFDVGVGAGFSSALLLGERISPWQHVESYVEALRGLLAGETVPWNGTLVGLLHGPASRVPLPADVPIFVAAEGPKGTSVASRVADGIITANLPGHNADLHPLTAPPLEGNVLVPRVGTVLDNGEEFDSPRVIEAAGPCAALCFHFGGYGPLAGTPELTGHLEAMAQVEPDRRHLVLHRGHMIEPNDIDRRFLTGDVIRRTTHTMTRSDMAAHLTTIRRSGARAVLYQPGGPDIPRELRAFREAAALTLEPPTPAKAER
jgi:5,10-methylenetetrahydromethanopterin reductase